jgi:hypothetical protein
MNPRNDALGLAERTRKNLTHMEAAFAGGADVRLITQVVNSLLGLIVFPGAALRGQRRGCAAAASCHQGWPSWEIVRGSADTLGQLVRCLRNAAAHGHIQFPSDSRQLSEVVIGLQTIGRARPTRTGLPEFWRRICATFVTGLSS